MKGQITCDFKFATFSCQRRRQHQQDAQEKDYSYELQNALEPAVCMVCTYTVKPVFSGHCKEFTKVVVIERWPFNQGSLFSHTGVHIWNIVLILQMDIFYFYRLHTKLTKTSKFGELWSPARQQL